MKNSPVKPIKLKYKNIKKGVLRKSKIICYTDIGYYSMNKVFYVIKIWYVSIFFYLSTLLGKFSKWYPQKWIVLICDLNKYII